MYEVAATGVENNNLGRSSAPNDGGGHDEPGRGVSVATQSTVSALLDPDLSTTMGGRRRRKVTLSSLQREAIEPRTSVCSNIRDSTLTKSSRLSERVKPNFSALKLYGRSRDIETLWQCFEVIREKVESYPEQRTDHLLTPSSRAKMSSTLTTSGKREQLVLISGNSGTGKSSLAQSLKEEVMEKGGFFVTGKFDLEQSDIPYAGFTDAMSELCQSLNEHRYGAGNPSWKFSHETIQAALHRKLVTDAPALSMVVPAMQRIFANNSTEANDTSNNSSYLELKYRFNRAFRTFIQVVSEFGPLVIVLDDLQWADPASLDLLYTLISGPNRNSSCMIMGLYRSEAIGKVASPLSNTILDIRSSTSEGETGFDLTEIEIGNLSVDAIYLMLVDLLVQRAKSTSQDTRLLAECVHQKTLGNAFFVAQFLRSLGRQGLLYFDNETEEWQWDVETIKIETSATDNVVEFMNNKLREMPAVLRQHMPLIASLGSSFRMPVVNMIFEHFGNDDVVSNDEDEYLTAEHFMHVCEEEGLLIRVADDIYQFAHDKMKSSALNLEKQETLWSLQFRFGRLLLDRLAKDELSDNIYMVANLLDHIEMLPEKDPSRVAIARVFLMAGKKAFLTSASLQASIYFRRGIDLLPEDHFVSQYELAVELYSSVAEADFCQGKFERMRGYCNLLLDKEDVPLLDKRRAYNAMLNSLLAEGRPYDARILCTEVLARLGVHFPRVERILFTLGWLLGMKVSWKRTISNVSNLEFTSDHRHVWIMSLLNNLTTCCYQTAQEMMPLVIRRGLKLALRNGLTIYAPTFLSSTALVCVIVEDFRGAKLYCDEALNLLDLVENNRDVEARTLFVAYQFVQHWQIPVEACLDPLLRAYKAGIASGDTENGGWSIHCYLEIHFFRGTNLDSLIDDCRIYAAQLKALKQVKIESFVRLLWQMMMDLKSTHSNDDCLTYDNVVDKFDLQGRILDNKDEHWQASFDRYSLIDAFWAGNYQEFLAIARITDFDKDRYAKNSPGTYGVTPLAFYIALAALAEAQETTTTWAESRKNFALGKKFTRKIQRWSSKDNPNVKHYEAILEAEIAAFKDLHLVAIKKYEAGIRMCESRGFVNDQALAEERFAGYLAKLGQIREAKIHVREAVRLYDSWGANSKSSQLRGKYFGHKTRIIPPTEICASIN